MFNNIYKWFNKTMTIFESLRFYYEKKLEKIGFCHCHVSGFRKVTFTERIKMADFSYKKDPGKR